VTLLLSLAENFTKSIGLYRWLYTAHREKIHVLVYENTVHEHDDIFLFFLFEKEPFL
jgi:hypothetical protein